MSASNLTEAVEPSGAQAPDAVGPLDIAITLAERWKALIFIPLLAGGIAAGLTYVIRPTYTGTTVFIPPQGQQGGGAAALASIGALASLTGAAAMRTPTDQYASLLVTQTVRNKLVDRFKLVEAYDVPLRHDAQKALTEKTRVTVGRRDGLITVEVDDHDAGRAADLANAYVEELRVLAGSLALTEAQQRKTFFETEVKATRARLDVAQEQLQQSGFNAQALRAEPKAAAENYARLQAQVTAAEVQLQALRRNLTDSAPEVSQQAALAAALRRELAAVASDTKANGQDEAYVSRYREFRYQETLYELLLRQFELARLDESRGGTNLQVVDKAIKPERRSSPKRGMVTVLTTLGTGFFLVVFFLAQASLRASSNDVTRAKLQRLRKAFQLRS
ncbi:MAG: lipopolysaccharide biosynthesis protein [Nitrospiraceae bacterium]|nr:lipopolysaccharide biosynthesis protein [Nitrospiraceae bacterium]